MKVAPVDSRKETGAAIWKVDRFAIHDGPGIRTNLYFKGCPLRCLWCSNPEGQREMGELNYSEVRCTGCGRCYDVCPAGALKPGDGRASLDFMGCTNCGQCVSVCLSGAISIFQRSYTLEQVMEVVKRDRHAYRRSGGGITCTGGEPFLQAAFLMDLLTACRDQGIHTAVESSGCVNPSQFRDALDRIDWLFLDLKHLDSERHRNLTGRDNAVILENLRTASSFFARTGKVLVIRQVVAPGLNDGDNIKALAEMAMALPRVDFVELLPYHAYGREKYHTLGRPYRLDDVETPDGETMSKYREIIERHGVKCRIGQT
ncbi:MAG: glycyl-radical enzyme activating protein [Dehalococcoidia bacterium]|nr:glycyl-radical enzyme activating protein [Dehalococcoidia bacterium]